MHLDGTTLRQLANRIVTGVRRADSIRIRRIAAAHALVLGMLFTLHPFSRLDAQSEEFLRAAIAGEDILAGLTAEERHALAELAHWVHPELLADGVCEDVRRNGSSFALFRDLSPAAQRQAVVEALPFGELIVRVADRHDMDPLLIAAVIEVESCFEPRAGSHKGAQGLMQLLPSTAGLPAKALHDPETNLTKGTLYLKELIERFDGDLELALAAYNAGPTNVRRFDGVPPFPETENYVEKVLGIYVGHHQQAWKASGLTELVGLTARA
ncbi:MAG TPA: lytic transglycosylase domain-containing protein [Thermoanaerobaculia bacterium]|nr:lytic transglycosylase domain-containing protein [Thermoanaerobaculia bacterium]